MKSELCFWEQIVREIVQIDNPKVSERMMNIEFREPKNINELEAIFRLRHEVYSNDPELSGMVNKSVDLDINNYDFNAFHFAAFKKNEIIACIRFSTKKETHHTPWVKSIVEKNQLQLENISNGFPFENYCPDKASCAEFLKEFENKTIGEVGKLAIQAEYRKGFELLNQFIQSFIDYSREELKVDTGFGCCTFVLERFYRKFGFYHAKSIEPFVVHNLPEAVLLRFEP